MEEAKKNLRCTARLMLASAFAIQLSVAPRDTLPIGTLVPRYAVIVYLLIHYGQYRTDFRHTPPRNVQMRISRMWYV